MLKQTVQYEDFDENQVTKVLYFNITKTELVERLTDLQPRLDKLNDLVSADPHVLSSEQVQEILDLVKMIMRFSYGVRSSDGERFIKNDEVWTEFTQTAVYDAFLFHLFEDPENAMSFITGVIPKDLREQAQKQFKNADVVQLPQTAESAPVSPVTEDNAPTQKDLREMTREELLAAMEKKNRENNQQ